MARLTPQLTRLFALRPMLPVTFQFIIATVAYGINEQLARRIEYLLEEVRVLREVYTETAGRKRIPFTDEQRRRLVIKGKALTPEEREVSVVSLHAQLRCSPRLHCRVPLRLPP